MAIHFVYAAAPGRSVADRARYRLTLLAQAMGVPVSLVGSRDSVDTSTWPPRAPVSITSRVYRELGARSRTLLYDWTERVPIPGNDRDVLIGHPFPGDEGRTWNRACREGTFALRIAMLPLSHRMVEINGGLDPYIPLVDAVFGIMGPYWYDTWQDSALAHWKEKIIPVDMAIDASLFPRVKRRFNPPGKRTFLYIGGSGAQKGTHLLPILFGLAKRHRCVWIGNGPPVPLVERRPWAVLDGPYLARLAEECDVFLTMGVSDANPTTILEAMAWGFPVCCTPQSGYSDMAEIVPLSLTDMRRNVETLERMQDAPEEELLARADAARRLVESRYNWERFLRTVVSGIGKAAERKGVDPWRG